MGARAPETEPLHAVTARSANSTARHALFCECWPFGPRSRSHFLCLDCLDLKVRLVHAGNLSRLRANGGRRSIRTKFSAHAKMRVSNCLTARSLASFDARQRTCDRRNRKRINQPCIALWDLTHPAPGTSLSAMGAEELEQQCVVGLDLCPRKVMTAMVELDETRMCNLLRNQLAQLPRNEEIIRGSNQQRRVADTAQAFCGVISESARRCAPPRLPAACSGTHCADQNPPARTALACET